MKRLLWAALAVLCAVGTAHAQGAAQWQDEQLTIRHITQAAAVNANVVPVDSQTIFAAKTAGQMRTDTTSAFNLRKCVRGPSLSGTGADSALIFRFYVRPTNAYTGGLGPPSTSLDSLNLAWQFSEDGVNWASQSAAIVMIASNSNAGKNFISLNDGATVTNYLVGAPGAFWPAHFVRFILYDDVNGEIGCFVAYQSNDQNIKR